MSRVSCSCLRVSWGVCSIDDVANLGNNRTMKYCNRENRGNNTAHGEESCVSNNRGIGERWSTTVWTEISSRSPADFATPSFGSCRIAAVAGGDRKVVCLRSVPTQLLPFVFPFRLFSFVFIIPMCFFLQTAAQKNGCGLKIAVSHSFMVCSSHLKG